MKKLLYVIISLFILASCSDEKNSPATNLTPQEYVLEEKTCYLTDGITREEVCMSYCDTQVEYYDTWRYIDAANNYCEYFIFGNKDTYVYKKVQNDDGECNGKVLNKEEGYYEFSTNLDNLYLLSNTNRELNLPILQFWVTVLTFYNYKDFSRVDTCKIVR